MINHMNMAVNCEMPQKKKKNHNHSATTLSYKTTAMLELLFKTSFETFKFFETPKLQKNDKNVNISSSSNHKRTNDGSLESPQWGASNGGKIKSLASIDDEIS